MKTPLRHNQRGFSHVLLVVLIVVVLAAIGVVGWRVAANKNNNKSSTTSSTSTGSTATVSSEQSACLTKYHDSDLCDFVSAEAQKPFAKTSAKVTITGTASSSASSGTITLSQDGKGNESFTLVVSGQSVNAVVFDNVTYIEENGTWLSYDTGSSSSSTTPPDSSLSSFTSDLSSVTFTKIGNAACGSGTCLKYQITDSTQPGATEYAYINPSNHLLSEYTVSDPSQGEQLTMTISYQAVTISKPSPVQSYSATGAQ